MVLDSLSESLRKTLKKIANATNVDKNLIKEVIKDIQRAMLQADVNVKLVLALTKNIETRALTEKPKPGMSSREHVIKIVHDELVNILGEPRDIKLKRQIIMMVGLYGQGKTTSAGKLAKYFQRKGMSPGVIAADVHRPGAYDQLTQIAKSINVPVYGDKNEKKAVKIVKNGLEKLKHHDIIIIDTSGRHSLEDSLIKEMKEISNIAKAQERFLVLDATIGQQAGPQAKAFHEAINVTGVILTKMDGTARGGGALSAVSETKAPVVFIGVGERTDDIEKFEPSRFISRLLGMGDIQSLLEKAEEVIDEEKAEKTAKKLLSGKFTLHEMYEQMDMLSDMGPLKKIMGMLPLGMTKKVPDIAMGQTQERLKKFKHIMNSMTDEEMKNPQIVKSSRIKRIARGSGTESKEVKALLKYYNQTRKMMKGFSSNRKMRKVLMNQMNMKDFNL